MSGRRTTTAAVVAAALVVLTGCAGEETPEATAPLTPAGVGEVTTTPDGVQEITVQTQDDYVFLPASFTVDPGTVRLTLVNVATEMPHNFEFPRGGGPEEIAAGISLVGPGEEKTVEFTVTQPGEHAFECSFHVQAGQVGTMTVRG